MSLTPITGGRFGEYLNLSVFLTRPYGMFVSLTYGTIISHMKGDSTLFLMHSGVVNGYQLLCDTHTVLEPHRGTAFFYFTRYHPFPIFLFMCLSHSDSPYFFCWVPLVCFNNL